VEWYEIAAHLSDARNDSRKQLDESGDDKNLEVNYEDNTEFEESPLPGKSRHLFNYASLSRGDGRL
jgi:hypothetical protein